jgi:hypothetical protein
VESWLISYVKKNEDIKDTLDQLSMNFRDLGNSLFDTKVRQEINIAPMRDYIENGLRNALTKITKADQEGVVTTGHGIPRMENTKGTLARR